MAKPGLGVRAAGAASGANVTGFILVPLQFLHNTTTTHTHTHAFTPSQTWAHYYRFRFWRCRPWARYVQIPACFYCAPLTCPGLERRRLLLWRRDMQRCHGLLRRKVR